MSARIHALIKDEHLRAVEAAAWRIYQERGLLQPIISDGVRELLEAAVKGRPEEPYYACPHCGDAHGAPWCFKLGRPISGAVKP